MARGRARLSSATATGPSGPRVVATPGRVIAIVLVTGLVVIAANLLAELTVAAVDPRVRTGRADVV